MQGLIGMSMLGTERSCGNKCNIISGMYSTTLPCTKAVQKLSVSLSVNGSSKSFQHQQLASLPPNFCIVYVTKWNCSVSQILLKPRRDNDKATHVAQALDSAVAFGDRGKS